MLQLEPSIVRTKIDECLHEYNQKNIFQTERTDDTIHPATTTNGSGGSIHRPQRRVRRYDDHEKNNLISFLSDRSFPSAGGLEVRSLDEDEDEDENKEHDGAASSSSQKHRSDGLPQFYYFVIEQQLPSTTDPSSSIRNNSDIASKVLIEGVACWSFGYSSWKGRVIDLDLLCCCGMEEVRFERVLMGALVDVAKSLDCARIVWKTRNTNKLSSDQITYGAEHMKGWYTLTMNRNAQKRFCNTRQKNATTTIDNNHHNTRIDPNHRSVPNLTSSGTITPDVIRDAIQSSIDRINHDSLGHNNNNNNNNNNHNLRLRLATVQDATSIASLVMDLATYEKAPEEVEVGIETYARDLGGESPLCYCVLLEEMDTFASMNRTNTDGGGGGGGGNEKREDDPKGGGGGGGGGGTVVGMGYWFLGYTLPTTTTTTRTNKHTNNKDILPVRFLYLEDLYIVPSHRKRKGGMKVMYCLTEIARALDCGRVVWQALDWNTPALKFYDSIGAKVEEGMETLRLDRERMNRFSL